MAGKDLARTSQTREPGPTIALVMMALIFLCMVLMNKFDGGSSQEGGLLL